MVFVYFQWKFYKIFEKEKLDQKILHKFKRIKNYI